MKNTENERKGNRRKEEVEAGRRIMGKEKQVVEVTLQAQQHDGNAISMRYLTYDTYVISDMLPVVTSVEEVGKTHSGIINSSALTLDEE